MAAGGNLSTTVAIILTFICLITYYKKNKLKIDINQKSYEENLTVKQLLKKILIISIPVTISSVVSVIHPLIDSTTVSRCIQTAFSAIYTSKEQLEQIAMSKTGMLSKIDTLVNLPLAVNVAFSTALVPVISAAMAKKDMQTASKRMTFSVFASLLIVLPCAAGFISLAQPILNLIYPSASDGALLLILYSIPMVFIAVNQTINGGLYGLNKTYIPLIAVVVGAIIKLILNVILISKPNVEITGAAISSIISQIVSFLICLIALIKNIKLNIKFGRMVLVPALASTFMGVCTYFINHALNGIVGNSLSTIISIILGVIIYVLAILLLKVLKKEEIMMLPFGTKIYNVLLKLKIYKNA